MVPSTSQRLQEEKQNPKLVSPTSPRLSCQVTRRKLAGYTSMGSPIYAPRPRAQSLGSIGGSHTPSSFLRIDGGLNQPCPKQAAIKCLIPFAGHSSSPPSIPPEPDNIQKAMEAAVSAERQRAEQLEEKERHYTANELKKTLKRERSRTGRLAVDLAYLRSSSALQSSHLGGEMGEEGCRNSLNRRLDTLRRDKERLMAKVEQEERVVTTLLNTKLRKIQKAKAALEEKIAEEEENLQLRLDLAKDSKRPRLSEMTDED